MIHILTVHWKEDCWVDVQLKYIDKYISTPYQTYAFLNYLPTDHSSKFCYSSSEEIGPHSIKLNLLADMACFNAESDEDILLFIDGDAFPISDVATYAEEKLKQFPLIAVQRSENDGDPQPHPCFCITTVGFWKKINGDWNIGHEWLNEEGKRVSDVGGNLLGILEKEQQPWFPMLRSNTFNLHPLWFGIYDSIVYHHGAGFRRPVSRHDIKNSKYPSLPFYLKKMIKFVFRYDIDEVIRQKIGEKNLILINKVFNDIQNNENFFFNFDTNVKR